MENICSNPGLQHLAENIFLNLDDEHLKICEQINESCRQMLDNAMFWLRKFLGLSKKNREDWIKNIQSEKNSDKEKFIISYLKWNFKKGAMADLACYASPDIQDDFRKKIQKSCFNLGSSKKENIETVKILAPLTENLNAYVQGKFRKKIWESCKKWGFPLTDEDIEIVKILAPLIDCPNAPNNSGETLIYWVVLHGHTELVLILAPLTDSPNTPNRYGSTPIHVAAWRGLTEIVKILAPVTDNPNAPNKYGDTPIHWAASLGHTEIVKILAPLTDYPNVSDGNGKTSIYWAAENGHTEIIKILAPLTDNPNAPDDYGQTPSSVAKNAEIRRILESK